MEERLVEMPVGSLVFMTDQENTYLQQQRQAARSSFGGIARYQVEDVSQYWPVYPSFERTMTLLKEQGIEAGTGLAPEKVDRIVIDVQNYFYEQQGELPEGEALAELRKSIPTTGRTVPWYLRIPIPSVCCWEPLQRMKAAA